MSKMVVPENYILAGILEFLQLHAVMAWRNNTGAVKIPRVEGDRFVRFGLKGSSDIIGCLGGGTFLAIEVKRANGKVTPEQDQFLEDIRARGGVAFVARSIDDVERELTVVWKRKKEQV